MTKEQPKPKRQKAFPTTSWTLVMKAAHSTTQAEESLNRLVGIYWPALYAYLVRDRGLAEHDAKDILQGFLADKVVQQDLIGKAERSRGKFRRFLVVALDRYAISVHRHQQAKRRSPGEEALVELERIPDDEINNLPEDSPAPHAAYDLVWAEQTIDEALRRLKEHCLQTDRASHWALFEERVVRPIWEGHEPEQYTEVIKQHGFASPLQASNAVLSVKRMFTRIFREVIRAYIRDEDLVSHELDDLMSTLRQFGFKGNLGASPASRDDD